MTCVNYLKLPDYSTIDIMRDKLRVVSCIYSRSMLQGHPQERPKSVTVREWLILCHCKQLNFTIKLEIGKSEQCHCNQMALYYVTVS